MAQLDLFVPAKDKRLPRHDTQNWMVLLALVSGRHITPLDALRDFGCMRLAAVVHELRTQYGVPIASHMVDLPTGKRVASYSIESSEVRREWRAIMFR